MFQIFPVFVHSTTNYWFFHKIVIWRRTQTNQILFRSPLYIHLLSHSISLWQYDFRALGKFHITFVRCLLFLLFFFFLFSSLDMFIFPFIIVFVPDARAQRLHFQRNKQSQIVDRITLFVPSVRCLFDYQRSNFWIKHQCVFFLFHQFS